VRYATAWTNAQASARDWHYIPGEPHGCGTTLEGAMTAFLAVFVVATLAMAGYVELANPERR
jgi:hypothetical protein